MKRIIITGEYQPHLESAFLKEVRRIKKSNPLTPVAVIIPTNALGRHLSRFLAVEMGGHAEIRCLTMLDFSRRLAEGAMSSEGLSPMPPLADLLLLRRSVEESIAGRDESYFKNVAGADGFLRVLLAAVNDLKEACLSPESLEGAAKKAPLGRVASGKIGEVARVWESYERRKTEAGLYDRSDLMVRASRAIGRDPWIKGLPCALFYGFYDLNPIQRRIVSECATILDTIFFFPFADSPEFDYARPTLSWLLDSGFEPYGGDGEDGGTGGRGRAKGEGASPIGGIVAELSLLSAAGEERECREIVREALKLGGLGGPAGGPERGRGSNASGPDDAGGAGGSGPIDGLRLNEIGILLRDPARYAGLFSRVLNGLGIEPFAGEGLPLSGVRAGRSLILFMELVESDFSRREVMDFLTFADLVVDEGAKEAPNTALWDLLSKEAGIVRGISDWRRKLSAMSARGWSPRSAGTEREDGGVDTGAAVKTLAEAVDHLYSKVSGLRAKDAPSRLAEDLCAAFCFFVGSSEERDIVLDEVRALSALDPCERSLDRSSFFWLVRRQLDSTQMRTGSMRGRGPVIAGLMTSRGLPFKVVVLPGLNEGSFPAPARQDPILLDWERSFLNEALEKLAVDGRLGLKGDRPKEERLLFRLAAGAASQRLILTFSRIEPLTGAERLASELLLETAGSVAGKRCGPGSLDGLPFYKRVPLDKLYPEDDSYLDGAEFDLMAAAGAVAKVRGALEYLKAGESFLSNSLDAESRRWGQFRFTPYDGVMESPKALKLLEGRYAGRRGIVSPTALETYAACPFRYFVRYILGAETIESPEEVLSIAPIDKGALAHSILENTYKRIFEGGSGPADGWEKTLHSIASRLLGAFRKENPFGLPLLWDIDEARLKDDLYMAMAQDIAELGGYVPWKQEVRFGYGPKSATEGDAGQEGVKATEMKLDDGRVVSFGGKIDRLDLDSAQGAARVIDYKTGKGAGYKEDSLVGGTTLQLPLYIIGAQQLLGCDAEVVDAQYFLVSGEKRGGRIHFTGEALRERMADLIMAVGTIVRGIESGLFFAYPGDSCMYCEYKPACGDGQNLYERKCTDPRVRDFLRMKEME